MKRSTFIQSPNTRTLNRFAISCAALLFMNQMAPVSAFAGASEGVPGVAGEPYLNMPAIAPLGVRIGKHLEWSTKLGGYDVYIWDQCYAMEQSLRIDEQ